MFAQAPAPSGVTETTADFVGDLIALAANDPTKAMIASIVLFVLGIGIAWWKRKAQATKTDLDDIAAATAERATNRAKDKLDKKRKK